LCQTKTLSIKKEIVKLKSIQCAFLLIFQFSIVKAQIVDDSTKTIYGTNTTKTFTQKDLYFERRYFYTKDSMFVPVFQFKKPALELSNYKKPVLYTDLELYILKKQDSIAKFKIDSAKFYESKNSYFRNPKPKPQNKLKEFKQSFKNYRSNLHPDSLKKKKFDAYYQRRFFKSNYYDAFPDSSINDIHNYNYVYTKNNIYQNQGIIGTPNKPVFYTPPTELGYRSGFNIYDIYFQNPQDLTYFDSRSTYTKIDYLNTTGGEDRIKGEISKNITRHWNVCLSYNRINTNKQMGVYSNANAGLSTSQDFKFYTSYKSNNERYHLMGSFNYFISRTNEQGGLQNVKYSTNATQPNDTLQFNAAPNSSWPVYLNATSSNLSPWITQGNIYTRDRRVAWHFFQQFDILKQGKLSVFHEFDRRNQKFRFEDPLLLANSSSKSSADSLFYRSPFLVKDSAGIKTYRSYRLNDSSFFNQDFAFVTNKLGLKYRLNKFLLIGFYKHRNIMSSTGLSTIQFTDFLLHPDVGLNTFLVKDNQADIQIGEHYLGTDLKYTIAEQDSAYFNLSAEIMTGMTRSSTSDYLKNTFQFNQDYQIAAKFKYYNFEAGISRSSNSPSMFQLYSFANNNYFWRNANMNASQTNYLYADYKFRYRKNEINLKPSFTQIQNYIYYDELQTPQQLAGNQAVNIFTLEAGYKSNLGILHYDANARYAVKNNDVPDVIRFPSLYANGKIFLNIVPKRRKGKQHFMFGLDFHYRSRYFGDGYMPAIGQFYIQNKFPLVETVIVDLFLTAKIKNATIFLRVNQIGQIAGLTKGYYITPNYLGTQPVLVIGVRWMLFD
jgi:hypothetical protein